MRKTLRKNQKGGIIINKNKDQETMFYDFINNSDITYLSTGGNGLVFKVVIRGSYISDYKYIDPDLFNEPVTELILKFSLMRDFNPADYDPHDVAIMSEYEKDEIGNFRNEVNKQTDIFLKSMEYLQPLCPAIVYSKILTTQPDKQKLIDTIIRINASLSRRGIPYDGGSFELQNPHLVNNPSIKIGVIAMECASGYNNLYSIKRSSISAPKKIEYINFSLFIILKLALDTGYSHGDFHIGNIMINSGLNYFEGIQGRPMIIDFGYTTKIPKPDMDIIKEFVRNGNYIRALKQLCQVDRADETKPNDPAWANFYGWICSDWDMLSNARSITPIGQGEIKYTTNDRLHELFQRREAYIDVVVEKFNELHARDPALYPLLPLSSAAKNQMYEGILSGGKKRKNKYLRKKRRTRRKNRL
jgi:hypothetical protein